MRKVQGKTFVGAAAGQVIRRSRATVGRTSTPFEANSALVGPVLDPPTSLRGLWVASAGG